jgi:hypothetical protein
MGHGCQVGFCCEWVVYYGGLRVMNGAGMMLKLEESLVLEMHF